MPILSLQNVEYAYPDGNVAVSGVSFGIGEGESVGLVGANGAGKSTLLMMLPGALQPRAGEILIQGEKLTKANAPALRRAVGLVFQDADDQLFTSTVRDDVAFGPRNTGLDEASVEEAVNRVLEATGIAALMDRAPWKLSGGEKKLASIASILSMDPKLLVMDEPSASLDPRARRKIIELVNRLPQAKLIASHDLDLVWDTCSRVIVLKQGKVAADGNAKTILADEKLLTECGLELPMRLMPPVG